jgi:hypothetical protein
MKKIILSTLLLSINIISLAQNRIIKIDFENHSIDNLAKLPYGEPFILEGTIANDIDFIEVSMSYEKSKKPLDTYVWDRGVNNSSQNFEMVITNPLKSNNKYDIHVKSFKNMSVSEKKNLEIDLINRIIYFLKNQINIKGDKIQIDNPKKVQQGLNTLLIESTYYQRSRNGITFDGLSSLVEYEIEKLGHLKLRKFVKKKNALEKNKITTEMLNEKIKYLAEIVISEIKPFLNSDLVQQKKAFTIQSVQTENEKFTLPVNVGMHVWNTSSTINNTTVKSTSLTPSVGITLPFSRGLNIKNKTINSFGFSLGVLTQPITNPNGVDLVTPNINLPLYTALGFKMFNFVRVTGGTLIVSEVGTTNFNKLQLYPTFGVAIELNVWVGLKR